jgi:outer membrane receptor for ferrienterochelin and colicins
VSHMRSWRWSLILAVASPVLSWAQITEEARSEVLASKSLEELMQMRIESVFGASKYEQKVTQAPASVTILTAEEIARFGHRSLAEALRSMSGLYVSNDRNYSYLGTRGFLRPGDYNTRVLVLIDGHRMNENLFDGAYFGHEGFLAVEAIERVEFVRGPSSSLYGSSAFFGIVNVVTKRGKQMEGPELAIGAGSLGTFDGRFSYGNVLPNETEVAFHAAYYSSDGHDSLYYPEFDGALSSDPRAANGGVAQGRDGEESLGFTASATHGELSLSASLLSRSKDVPTASFGTVFNAPEQTNDHRGFLDLTYRHAFAPELDLMGRLSYDHYSYLGKYTYDYEQLGDPAAFIPNRDEALGTWLTTEWQVTRKVAGRHTLIGGFEYRQNLHQRLYNYDVPEPRVVAVDVDQRSHNAAVYGQGEFALTRQLLLNAGMRYDYYADSFGGTLNPRVGLIYSPHARSTFKLLYGQAFRAPSAYERFYYPMPDERDVIEPETIRTYEVVFEQYMGQLDRLNVSVYRYDVHSLVTQVGAADETFYFDNLTHVHANGIELEIERKLTSGALARLSYTFQRTEDVGSGQILTNSPRHIAKLNVGAPLGHWLEGGLELQYQSGVETLVGHGEGFLLGNLHLSSRNLPHGLQVSAGLYNLFDTRYGIPGAEDHAQSLIEQDGRTLRIELMRRF